MWKFLAGMLFAFAIMYPEQTKYYVSSTVDAIHSVGKNVVDKNGGWSEERR